MSKAHDAGDIDVVIDNSKFSGDFGTMAQGVNAMVAGHIAVKNVMLYYGSGLYPGMGSPFLFSVYCGLAVTSLAIAGAFSLSMLREILREDPSFRRYMFWMSLYGSGNLMMNAQLVVLFSDRLQLASLTQILLLTVVPMLLIPLFLPWWARLFDRGHIIEYRSRQCWALVAALLLLTLGVAFRQTWLLWPGAVLIGMSYAGANLGWNLGHNDFATPGRAQHYMGVNVTLTGVRGLIAPPVGMACYELLERVRSGWGAAALLLPLGLVTAGAIGFVRMREVTRQSI